MHPDQRGGGTIGISLAYPRVFGVLQCTVPHLKEAQMTSHVPMPHSYPYQVLSRSLDSPPPSDGIGTSSAKSSCSDELVAHAGALSPPCLPLFSVPVRTENDPASNARSETGPPCATSIPYRILKDIWQHLSLAPEVQKQNLSYWSFGPTTCPCR